MTALDLALDYIGRGWNPVPVPFRGKKPLDDEWQKRIIDAAAAPAHFNGNPMNVGVQLGANSCNLNDVDLDCHEAIVMAAYILPQTKAIFGRTSKRNSHRLYYSDLPTRIDKAVYQFHDPNTGEMLLELRIGGCGKGAQTVFPGSTHESGEPIKWEIDGEVAAVAGNDLYRRACELAACCLIARYWPSAGSRHHGALVIGGFLARVGKTEIELKLIMDAIAHAVIDEEWGDRRSAVKDAAEAYRSGKTAYGFPALAELIGRKNADKVAEWLDYQGEQHDEHEEELQADAPSLGEWDAGDDVEKPPPRGWLLGNIFARCFISSLIAEGGTGKTALRYAQYLSLATGKSLTGEHVFQRCRVLIVSLEDDARELRRRILAAMLHYKIDRSELRGWLFLAAPGAAGGKLMTLDKKGRSRRGALADALETVIVTRKIDLISLDPFVKTHSVEENSNSAIDDVVQVLADLAAKHDVSIDVPHHTSKGAADPGNANRGRGASAMKDGGRLIYTLTTMTPEEAQTFGIPEEERRCLIRMDSAKINITPPAAHAKWFRLVGVRLDNSTELYPHGDNVQTVEPWFPPDIWTDMSVTMQERILAAIDAGLPDGNRYTDAAKAGNREAWRVVAEHVPSKTETQAREIIKRWLKDGQLERRPYQNPITWKDVSGLYRP